MTTPMTAPDALARELERLRDAAVEGEYAPSKMVALQMKAAFNIDTIIAALKSLAALDGVKEALQRAPIPSKYHGMRGFELERFLADYETFVRDKIAALARLESDHGK